jgi:hypothetical protein
LSNYDFCKGKAKEIAHRNPTITYVGLAVLHAQDIRATGSKVHDSREEYCGHAHISHGIIVPRDEPQNSELNMVVTERCRDLATRARY